MLADLRPNVHARADFAQFQIEQGCAPVLARSHSVLLRSHGMDHLDISEIRSRNRPVTQAMSRDLYNRGAAGLLFKSNLDNEQCLVVFEGVASLEETDEPALGLTEDVPELLQVCSEYGLILRR